MTKYIKKSKIYFQNLNEFNQRIDKLNRKLKKLDLPIVRVIVSDDVTTSRVTVNGNTLTVKEIEVTVEWDCDLVINGYQLVATLENIEGNIFSSYVPNTEVKEKITELTCDHCQTKRYRKHGYILEEVETGKRIVVGKTCLKDFIGHDPKAIIAQSQFNVESEFCFEEDSSTGFFRNSYMLPLYILLKITCAIIRKHGFTSKSKAEERGTMATAIRVIDYFMSDADILRDWQKEIKTLARDIKEAHVQKIIHHFEEKLEQTKHFNSYLDNIQNILNLQAVPYKYIAYAVSMPAVYEKDFIQSNMESIKESAISNFIGNVKDRLSLKVKLSDKHSFEGRYGLTTVYTFETPEQDKLKWFASSNHNLEIGFEYSIVATIKKHEYSTYSKQNETQITRCKIK